ncbi:hypothetical protein [Roseobacter weihaiensis]|uniref:hypothetical protein n=1 Tax=Roseobacter weihaiensis TaxID=2763262 RepID=UPI001D0B9CEB|nr:hypothetical protein [Roseobacter sp. H9]
MKRLTILLAATVAAPALAQGIPQAELKLHLDLRDYAPEGAYYRGSSAAFGDLNGDGDRRDFIRHVNSTRMQAFAFNGKAVELLWDYESGLDLPDPSNRYFYKYVIWDIDGDGQDEVTGAFATEGGMMEMRVLDGATGAIEATAPLNIANPESDDNNRALRVKTVVADLAGDGLPSELILIDERGSRGDVHAFASDLTLIWDTTEDDTAMIHAHYPWPYDIDGDGADEVLTRYLHDETGARVQRVTPEDWILLDSYFDHLDKAMAADILADNEGMELAFSYEGLHVAVLDGETLEEIWRSQGVHKDAKFITIGEWFPESEGPELLLNWAISDDGSEAVTLSAAGEELHRWDGEITDGLTMDWDGDRTRDEVFSSKYGRLFEMPPTTRIEVRDAYYEDAKDPHHEDMRLYAHALDMLGDYREEIVFLDENELLIYGAAGDAPADHPSPFDSADYALAVANMHGDNHTERGYLNWQTLDQTANASQDACSC